MDGGSITTHSKALSEWTALDWIFLKEGAKNCGLFTKHPFHTKPSLCKGFSKKIQKNPHGED